MEKRVRSRVFAPSRRDVLKVGLAGLLASEFATLDQLAQLPVRLAMAAAPRLPDIQFDIGNFIPPAFAVNGVLVRFATIFTTFTPAKLTRTPTRRDQEVLANALGTIEDHFAFSPKGVFLFVAYGVPYFNRLRGGLTGKAVSSHVPKLLSDPARLVLEEAVPSPTDVSPVNPGITKKTFNVPVMIEANDVLLTMRSDSTRNIQEILAWLAGSDRLKGNHVPSPDLKGLFHFQRTRVIFQQIGLPRKVANANKLPYAKQINPQSPMWMGFADQQVDSSGPAAITTFVGNASARVTDAMPGDYFDNGSLQHLSHDILDLAQFYELPAQDPAGVGETFKERVQYMFRSNQMGTPDGLPSSGNTDQFTDGGGPAFLDNVFQGANAALMAAQASGGAFSPAVASLNATFNGEHRVGHEEALQRSSRAADGTPMHIRMDGTGFDNMDVPDKSKQPKLEFTALFPSAEFFRVMRVNAAAQDLVAEFGVNPEDNGLERFLTATRRQNFLMPPRRHRAFPLLEFTENVVHAVAAPNAASSSASASRTAATPKPSAAPSASAQPSSSGGSRSGGGSQNGAGSRGGGGSHGGRG